MTGDAPGGAAAPRRVTRFLAARAPFAGAELLAFLEYRAVPGVEDVAPYRRSLRLAHGAAVVTLRPAPDGIDAALDLDDARDEPEALQHLTALLDLDAPAPEIAAVLGPDFTPGLRVPGGDGYEIATRAVLTQQISVKAARTHAARLVQAAGEPLAEPRGTVTHLFPTAEAIAQAPDGAFAMPVRRRQTLRSLAQAPLDDLIALPGVGPWTQSYVDMRALRDRDAWLPTDLGVRHGLERRRLTATDADRWRPYRAYAVMGLWSSSRGSDPLTKNLALRRGSQC